MATRRQHGEGTVFQRNGRWGAAVPRPPDGSGKRPRLYRLVPRDRPNTEAEAHKLRVRLLKEVAAGQHDPAPAPPAELPTVEGWLATWLSQVDADHAPNTRVLYERRQRIYIVPAVGHHQLDQLSVEHVARMVTDLRRRYAATTVGLILRQLRAALTMAVDWGLIERNVAARVKPPKVNSEERPTLMPAQARALLAMAAGTPFEVAVTLAVCGLRRGEIVGLRWRDLDLERGRLMLAVQARRQDGHIAIDQPLKTRQSRRTLVLPPFTTRALAAQRDRQRIERGSAGATWQDRGLVLTTDTGGPIDFGRIERRWRQARATLEVPEMHFHDLRHSAASLLGEMGVHPRTIAAILGHAGLTMTGHYVHASEASLEAAAEALNGAIGG